MRRVRRQRPLGFVPSFNPRTRTGCDVVAQRILDLTGGFNPRPRTGCDTLTLTLAPSLTAFQSTHPHGVRRESLRRRSNRPPVSIHAPARGATTLHSAAGQRHNVSIHAPARGATTTDVGQGVGGTVSIHAPARGATRLRLRKPQRPPRFNPRTRTGCDCRGVVCMAHELLFQSTHPHGVRLKGDVADTHEAMFQSTHPHGVRPSVICQTERPSSSFNPRTRTGCDTLAFVLKEQTAGFNPRTRTGCDWLFGG